MLNVSKVIICLFWWMAFQDIVSMGVAKYISISFVAPVILIKDAIYLTFSLLLIYNIATEKKLIKHDLFVLFILFFLSVNVFFISDFSNESFFPSFRQILILIVSYLVGRFFFIHQLKWSFLDKNINVFFTVMIITSFIERFVFFNSNESFFVALGYKQFAEAKGFSDWLLGVGVSKSFYTYDFSIYGFEPIRRMAGIMFANPVILGQFLAFPFIYFLVKKSFIGTFFTLLSLLLCFSKGGILAASVGVLLYIFFRLKFSKGLQIFCLFFLFLASLPIVIYLYININSVFIHTNGFLHNVSNLVYLPLGNGIGEVGNYAGLFNEDISREESKGESYLGTLIGQLGLLGWILWLSLLVFIFKKNPQNEIQMSVQYSSIGFLIVAIFSESAIAYTGISLILALAIAIPKNRNCNPPQITEGRLV
tara:strand:- start:2830 stop:4095 length:1266 start_codon:yes stop_codon:yes gene_type:complete